MKKKMNLNKMKNKEAKKVSDALAKQTKPESAKEEVDLVKLAKTFSDRKAAKIQASPEPEEGAEEE